MGEEHRQREKWQRDELILDEEVERIGEEQREKQRREDNEGRKEEED